MNHLSLRIFLLFGYFLLNTSLFNLVAGNGLPIKFDQEKNYSNSSAPPCTLTLQATSIKPVSCNGRKDGSATVSVSSGTGGPYTFSWSNGNNGITSGTALTVTGLSAATYTLVVGEDTCLASTTIVISEPAPISIAIGSVITTCGTNTGSLSVTVVGNTNPYSYTWSTGATASSISSLAAGIYTITVVDSKNCSHTATASVNNSNGFSATAIVTSNVSCSGLVNGSGSVSISGGTFPYVYTWSNGASTKSINSLAAGPYSLTVKDANGCSFISRIDILQPPILTVAISTTPSCGGLIGTAKAEPTGGSGPYSYSWNNSATTAKIIGLNSGTYNVTVTDANGCKFGSSASVGSDTPPSIALKGTPLSCNGSNDGAVSVFASGGTSFFSFSWSNGASGSSVITGLSSAIYSVTVTNSSGCSAVKSIYLSEPPFMYAVAGAVSTSCGNSNGTVFVSAGGGTGILTYTWSNGASGITVSGLSPGSYSVTVTDSTGCFESTSAIVTNSNGVNVTLSISSNVTCNGGNDGIVVASASPSTSPIYTYSWSTGVNSTTSASTNVISGLNAGIYSVTVSDNNGCTSIDFDTIAEPPPIGITSIFSNLTATTSCDGSIIATATGGVPGYSYHWSNGANGQSTSNLCSGFYTITVTDTNGCVSVDSVRIFFDTNTGGSGSCDLHIYNMITPNGDGSNDYWHIDCIADHPGNQVAIFNRWGNKLWESTDYNNTDRVWKGNDQKGTPMPEGTYFYVIKTFTKQYSGKVELLK